MPALSPTMEEGKLAKWLVKEGDEVHSGDVLAEIETDKATMEFEAVDEGRIGKILVPEGTEGVKVNQPIANLLQEGEDGSGQTLHRRESQGARREACRGGQAKAEAPLQAVKRRRSKSPTRGSPSPARHRTRHYDRARSVARRHGGRNAPRRRPCS